MTPPFGLPDLGPGYRWEFNTDPLIRAEKVSSWTTISEEMGQDAPYLNALIEYLMTRRDGRLTLRERITGHRTWRASSGVVLHFDVSWRLSLRRVVPKLRRS